MGWQTIRLGDCIRPRLHEQIKPPLIAQILDPYEVTPDEFAQIKYVLFAHVDAAFVSLARWRPRSKDLNYLCPTMVLTLRGFSASANLLAGNMVVQARALAQSV